MLNGLFWPVAFFLNLTQTFLLPSLDQGMGSRSKDSIVLMEMENKIDPVQPLVCLHFSKIRLGTAENLYGGIFIPCDRPPQESRAGRRSRRATSTPAFIYFDPIHYNPMKGTLSEG